METKNPFQVPRLEEIEAGRQFWGYLDTEALRTRYVIAAHFVRHAAHIVEVGGYRDNVITNFVTSRPDSITVFSLDAEFEPLERDTLNGAPCRVRHIRDYVQHHTLPDRGLAVIALGLEIHGDLQPFIDLVSRADVAVLEISPAHAPAVDSLACVRSAAPLDTRCEFDIDYSASEALVPEHLRQRWMNTPFWKRRICVLERAGRTGIRPV